MVSNVHLNLRAPCRSILREHVPDPAAVPFLWRLRNSPPPHPRSPGGTTGGTVGSIAVQHVNEGTTVSTKVSAALIGRARTRDAVKLSILRGRAFWFSIGIRLDCNPPVHKCRPAWVASGKRHTRTYARETCDARAFVDTERRRLFPCLRTVQLTLDPPRQFSRLNSLKPLKIHPSSSPGSQDRATITEKP